MVQGFDESGYDLMRSGLVPILNHSRCCWTKQLSCTRFVIDDHHRVCMPAAMKTWSQPAAATMGRSRTCRCPSSHSLVWWSSRCCAASPPSWAQPRSYHFARQLAWWCGADRPSLCRLGKAHSSRMSNGNVSILRLMPHHITSQCSILICAASARRCPPVRYCHLSVPLWVLLQTSAAPKAASRWTAASPRPPAAALPLILVDLAQKVLLQMHLCCCAILYYMCYYWRPSASW
jgi:hypothetical protein